MKVLAQACLASSLILMGASASAQTADGKWAGKIENGASVEIEIASNTVQSYAFRGKPVKIWNSRSSGNEITFTAGNAGTVVLKTGSGKTLSYAYSDTYGGAARAVLTKR